MKKAIKKVASGLQRDSEKSWFAELSDKGIKLIQKSKLSCVCIYLTDKGLLSAVTETKAFLSFLVKCTKTHIYYAMKNCNGDGNALKTYMMNIIDHCKVHLSIVCIFPINSL